MTEQLHDQPQDEFAKLRSAIVADFKRHVATLREAGVEFYGYAALPPDYYTQVDPTTISVAFNLESDIDESKRDDPYYRYSVDEWENYVHDGFDASNNELKALLAASRSSDDDPIDGVFVNSIYQAVLDSMLALQNDDTFDGVTYLVVWIPDSGDGILNRSAKLLNSSGVYAEFASEFDD